MLTASELLATMCMRESLGLDPLGRGEDGARETEPVRADLEPGQRVAVADGSVWQYERGTVLEVDGDAVKVRLDAGITYRVEWWKDVQPI